MYKKVLRDTGLQPEQCAVIGDQLLTDILGGNRMHFVTILINTAGQPGYHLDKVEPAG